MREQRPVVAEHERDHGRRRDPAREHQVEEADGEIPDEHARHGRQE
jgi:hypothetical protein